MWQRFSESARQAVLYAQEVAQRLGVDQVGPEMILCGILHVAFPTEPLDDVPLALKLQQLKDAAESRALTLKPGESGFSDKPVLLSDQGKKVVDAAYEQSQVLEAKELGCQHLLVGVVQVWATDVSRPDGETMNLLESLLDPLVAKLVAVKDVKGRSQLEVWPRPMVGALATILHMFGRRVSGKLVTAFDRLEKLSSEERLSAVLPGHVLRAVLQDESSSASRLLLALGIELDLASQLLNRALRDLAPSQGTDLDGIRLVVDLLATANALADRSILTTAHVLLAAAQLTEPVGVMLRDVGVTPEALQNLMKDPAFAEPSAKQRMVTSKVIDYPWEHDDLMICGFLKEQIAQGNSKLGGLRVTAEDLLFRIESVKLRSNRNHPIGEPRTTMVLLKRAFYTANARGQELSLGHILHASFEAHNSRTREALLELDLSVATFLDAFGLA